MEKLEKKKHDHKLTKWLKFGIFAVIMVAPFLSVLSKCVYVATNKNAKESYYGQTINESKQIYLQSTNVSETETYYINYEDLTYTQDGGNLYIHNFDFVSTGELSQNNYNTIMENRESIYRLYFGYNNNLQRLALYRLNEDNTQTYIYAFLPSEKVIIKFNIYTIMNSSLLNIEQYIYYFEYNKYSYLDNVFEYGVNQLNENNLYNWSKQTGIYTAIYNMTNGLGANDVLAMLLAYWGILTAIYIVFDIVIECFTKLTHLLAD